MGPISSKKVLPPVLGQLTFGARSIAPTLAYRAGLPIAEPLVSKKVLPGRFLDTIARPPSIA